MSADHGQYESLQGRMIGENIPSIEDYNKGVEDAIEVVKKHYIPGHNVVNQMMDAVIIKLKSLKKQTI